jgi:hypothetical protein
VPRKVLARLDVETLKRLERSNFVGGNTCELLHSLCSEVIRGQLVGEETRRLCAAVAIGGWGNQLALDLRSTVGTTTFADLIESPWAHATDRDLDGALVIAERAVAAAAATSEIERVDAGPARAELWSLQLGWSDEGCIALGALRASQTQLYQIARVDGATELFLRMPATRARSLGRPCRRRTGRTSPPMALACRG